MRQSSILTSILGIVFFAAASPSFAGYTIRNLGTQLNHAVSAANAINNKGWVVGYTRNPTTLQRRAFLIKPPYSGMINLGTYDNYRESEAKDINNNGVVVGISTDGGSELKSLFWSNGALAPLPDLDGETITQLVGINDECHAVGASGLSAYLYLNGVRSELPNHPDSINLCAALAINNNNFPVGYQYIFGLPTAIRWVQGSATIIPTLGGNSNEARDIADNGLIVGVSNTTNNTAQRAFSYMPNGTPQNLGSLGGNFSTALATNGTDIVGYSKLSDNTTDHAFIFTEGIMIDLNDYLRQGSGWVLQRATGINASGQICGYGTFNGDMRAFLLTPSPPMGDYADWDLTVGHQNWTAVTNVPPFEPAETQWEAGSGHGLRATAFPSFAFLQSPEITLQPGKTYRVWCTVVTTATAAEAAPQIRLRAFQTTTNMSEMLALDSVGNALPANSASQTYEFTLTTQISGPAQSWRFALDYTFFNPFDEQDAWVYLERVIVAED